jgi:hypothetical protein
MSEGRYSSLNCAYASKDDPLKVRENRKPSISGHWNRRLILTIQDVKGEHRRKKSIWWGGGYHIG